MINVGPLNRITLPSVIRMHRATPRSPCKVGELKTVSERVRSHNRLCDQIQVCHFSTDTVSDPAVTAAKKTTSHLLSPTLHHLREQGDSVQVDEFLRKCDVTGRISQILQGLQFGVHAG